MQVVPDVKVRSRFSNGHPQTLELVCPHCLREEHFLVKVWHEQGRLVAVADVPCSHCANPVLLVQLLDSHGAPQEAALYAHPPAVARENVPGLEHLGILAGSLGRTYESALQLYNRAEWGASALVLRHLLAGLARRLLGGDRREAPLPRLLEALAKDVDLSQPLQDLAQLLAPTGPLGRQFEDHANIDQSTAARLLDLVDNLISYLVVLPAESARIKGRIANAPVPLRREDAA